jgi:hypothetical protein
MITGPPLLLSLFQSPLPSLSFPFPFWCEIIKILSFIFNFIYSCLFNAIGYVLEGELQSRAKPLRSLVAYMVTRKNLFFLFSFLYFFFFVFFVFFFFCCCISNIYFNFFNFFIFVDSDEYTEAVLGKPIKEYASWIQQPNSWGGMISFYSL